MSNPVFPERPTPPPHVHVDLVRRTLPAEPNATCPQCGSRFNDRTLPTPRVYCSLGCNADALTARPRTSELVLTELTVGAEHRGLTEESAEKYGPADDFGVHDRDEPFGGSEPLPDPCTVVRGEE